ncbi:host attachment family protein [Lichenibacterium ramalinae]|uniref:Host attachment protein n=1 Tax=Lichenibacterium ramalinae TaxID=2316527 RepID=A0A4V1RIM7_9HYPH|nr:host attachment family protein [Lichenibacterium ramalinae]RYB04672.1 host attachment protein [Lichenibacterium ramalinae]
MTTLKVHYGAWVMVGDGKKALFLHNEGDDELMNLRRLDVEEKHNPATRDQGSDAPGRGHSPMGNRGGSMGGTDFHQVEEDRFAAHVAGRINAAAQENGFKEIVIVAPPKCLAEIRRDLSPEAQKRVVCEIPKDYTHHPIPQIEKLLAGHAMG